MASWAEFEAAEPEFASRVRALMVSRKHLTMATLRRDGSPRISGTEVEFTEGQLRIGSMPGAVKGTVTEKGWKNMEKAMNETMVSMLGRRQDVLDLLGFGTSEAERSPEAIEAFFKRYRPFIPVVERAAGVLLVVVGLLVLMNYYVVLNSWAISLTPEWLLKRL